MDNTKMTRFLVKKGMAAQCPSCGGPLVWDSDLWHCDPGPENRGCGAWDNDVVFDYAADSEDYYPCCRDTDRL